MKRLKRVLVEMRLPLVCFGTLVVFFVATGTNLEEVLWLLVFVVVMGVFFLGCYRPYHLARRKGYNPTTAAAMVFGVMFAGVVVEVIVIMIQDWPRHWSNSTENAFIFLILFGVLLAVAARVYIVRRKGYNPTSATVIIFGVILLGWLALLLVLNLKVETVHWSNLAEGAFVLLVVFGMPLLASAAVVAALPRRTTRRAGPRGPWPPLEDSKYARTLQAALKHDPRPPVLYLRAFYRESSAFTGGLMTAMARYVHSEVVRDSALPVYAATFEQYLGATLTQEIGPFVALGNPEDYGRPEGAARLYADDRSWQQEFLGLAESAAAIVMEPSYSMNLRWELATLRSHDWQCKLFVITQPGPRAKQAVLNAMMYALKSIPAPQWDELVIELAHTGYEVNPMHVGPGSVVSFNMAGRAEILTRGAREPEEFTKAIRTRLETLTKSFGQ